MFARSLALVLLTFPAMATPLMAGEDIGIIDSGTDRVSLDLPSDDTPPPPDIDGATPWYFDNETGEWVYLTIIDDDPPPPNVYLPPESFDPTTDPTTGGEEGCSGCDDATPITGEIDPVPEEFDTSDVPPPAIIDGATPWYFDHGTGEWVYSYIIDDSNLMADDTTPPDFELPPDEVEFTKGDEEGCDGCDVHAFGVPGSEETDSDDIEIRLRSFTPDVTAATDDPEADMPSEPAVVATSGEAIDPALLEELRARVEAELLRRATDG
jgi:hypothetical protein